MNQVPQEHFNDYNTYNLNQWLHYCETLHVKTIDMGLERVKTVWQRMQTPLPKDTVVFMVGGTNGKGSTCKYIEQILLNAGYRVGLYTSPHLLDFKERIAIQGVCVEDALLCQGFHAVNLARLNNNDNTDDNTISLTYFEFITLVALYCYARAGLDAVVLEVGLGGRLDAVNIIDADCSVITSIDLDHQAYLGNTREAIAFEKAHIYRPYCPAICTDPAPPDSLLMYAQEIKADLWLLGRDFNYSGDQQQWNWAGRGVRRSALNYPALRGANQLLNASGAIAAIQAMAHRLPITASALRQGFIYAALAGRFQVLAGQPTVILDVAHNPHAGAVLAHNLDAMGYFPNTNAVFSALNDKDVLSLIHTIKARIDHWHIMPLSEAGLRTLSVIDLNHLLITAGVKIENIHIYETISDAYQGAYTHCQTTEHHSDRVVVFGSFLTVAGVMKHLNINAY